MSEQNRQLLDNNHFEENIQDKISDDTGESRIYGDRGLEGKEPINTEFFKEKPDEPLERLDQLSLSANIPVRTDGNEYAKEVTQTGLRTLLLQVVKTQGIILKEIHSLKDAMRELSQTNTALQSECRAVAFSQNELESHVDEALVEQRRSVEDMLLKQKQECKGYTDSELRTLESKVNGLAAVLEHVQKRCLEKEMKDEVNTEHESISSSDSAEDEVKSTVPVSDEGFLSELIQEKRNRCWLRQNHVKLLNAINPQHDLLLHHLAQENILTQSDEEKILSHSTRKEQSRELLLRLRRCTSGQFKSFLRHLGSEHNFGECATSVDDDTGEADDFSCAICDVITLAQVDDVIDHVYQHDYIDVVSFEDVMKMSSARDRWCRLLGKLADKSVWCGQVAPAAVVSNDRPIIGIFMQRSSTGTHGDTFLSANYVKFIEQAGARVVPIRIRESDQYYQQLFSQINGVVYPGGHTGIRTSDYAAAGKIIYDLAEKANDAGDVFPLLGICEGFQMMTYLSTGHNLLHHAEATNVSLTLKLEKDYQTSRLMKDMPADLIHALSTEAITPNFHHFGVSYESYQHSKSLREFYKVISTSRDSTGKLFISTIEGNKLLVKLYLADQGVNYQIQAYKYPFYAVQWHPEKMNFA